jgi:hypothetical protein
MELALNRPFLSSSLKLSAKSILLAYWILPITWLIIVIDKYYFNYSLTESLPQYPEQLAWFPLLFVTPHIVASFITFFDAEYLSYYKKSLLISAISSSCVMLLLPAIFGLETLLAVFIIWTSFHFVGQNIGMSLMFTRTKHWSYSAFKYLAIATSAIIYLDVVLNLSARFLLTGLFNNTVLLLFAASTITIIIYNSKITEKTGIKSVWLNYILLLSSILLYRMQLPFFIFLGIRIIHDCNAFLCYAIHDHNRNYVSKHNVIYRFLTRFGLPILILCPLIACAISYVITTKCIGALAGIAMWLAFFHYHTDSFAWKRGSLHRQQIYLK